MIVFAFVVVLLIGFFFGQKYGMWRAFHLLHREDREKAQATFDARKSKYL